MVDFDARDDALAGEEIDEILAVVGVLAGGFVEEDDAADVVCDAGSGEEDVAVITTVVVGVCDAELVEFLVDAATGLVGGEDAFTFDKEAGGNELEVVSGVGISGDLLEAGKGKSGV